MTQIMALGTAFLLSWSAHAADTILSARELKQAATQEIQTPADTVAVKAKTASDAAMDADATSSGILRLQDDYHSLKARRFLMSFGVQMQAYKPQGRSDASSTGSSYALSDAGSTVLPSVSLGSLYNLGENRSGQWQIGLEGEAGYTSQKASVNTSSGAISARLNTTLLEVRPLLRWAARNSKFHLFTGYGFGHATITQSSATTVGQWTKGGNTTDFLLGADYAMSEKWLIQLTSKNMTLAKADEGFDLPSNQIELGAKVLW